jgi:hypothetical protein
MAETLQVVEEGSGRVKATVKLGAPEAIGSDLVDAAAIGQFVEVLNIPTEKRSGGELLITGQGFNTQAGIDYFAADVEVVGFIGSASTIIMRAAVANGAAQLRVRWGGDGESFSRVALNARTLVNGAGSSASGLDQLQLQITGRLY